jgi:pimeloyl-ACP methyl ester carboxylesterase
VPTTAIGVIADWVVAQSTLVLPRPRLVARQDTTAPRMATSELRESVLRFGPADAMFGIVTEPPQPPAANTPAIVLSNAGAVHHVGPNGLYVDLARSLSRAGFRVLRFDIPGIGDSVTDGDARENVPYQPDATAILSAAMDALAGRAGVSSFVLMGLCSGAHASFHAAAEVASHRIVEAVLINPLTFNYTTGMSLDAPSMPHIGRWQRYRESMTSVRGWRKLLRPEVRIGELVRDVVRRAALVVGLTPRSRESSAVEAALLRLSDRGRRLTLVCSRFDPGHDLLMLGARRTARALKRAGRLDTWVIDDANHTFDGSRGRAAVVTTITRALAVRYVDRRI